MFIENPKKCAHRKHTSQKNLGPKNAGRMRINLEEIFLEL